MKEWIYKLEIDVFYKIYLKEKNLTFLPIRLPSNRKLIDYQVLKSISEPSIF